MTFSTDFETKILEGRSQWHNGNKNVSITVLNQHNFKSNLANILATHNGLKLLDALLFKVTFNPFKVFFSCLISVVWKPGIL